MSRRRHFRLQHARDGCCTRTFNDVAKHTTSWLHSTQSESRLQATDSLSQVCSTQTHTARELAAILPTRRRTNALSTYLATPINHRAKCIESLPKPKACMWYVVSWLVCGRGLHILRLRRCTWWVWVFQHTSSWLHSRARTALRLTLQPSALHC